MRFRDRLIMGTASNFIDVAFNQGNTFIINIIVVRILLKHTFVEFAMLLYLILCISLL